MKNSFILNINPNRIMNTDELKMLKGGDYDPDKCGTHCTSETNCCNPCPKCVWAPGYPDSKICTSP